MTAVSVTGSEQIKVSALGRDYRLSLAILVLGIFVLVSSLAFSYLGMLTGSYPTSGNGSVGLAVVVIGSAGFAMIWVGAIWGSHNRSLLRESQSHA